MTRTRSAAGRLSFSAKPRKPKQAKLWLEALEDRTVPATFNVTSTASGVTTTIDGKDDADIYTITHTALAGALNVTDTGATGTDQLTDNSTAAGPASTSRRAR